MQTFKTSKSRENILGKIRKELNGASLPMPFPEVDKVPDSQVFAASEASAEELFAEKFIALGGKFVFCDNEQELLENIALLHESKGWGKVFCSDTRLLQLFHNNKLNTIEQLNSEDGSADVCITGCELLAARTGSMIFSSRQDAGRVSSVFYPAHIVVAYANQVVPDIQDAVTAIKAKHGSALPSMINLNTGPSRTADIEKTLVVGVHGPGEVYCFYVNADL